MRRGLNARRGLNVGRRKVRRNKTKWCRPHKFTDGFMVYKKIMFPGLNWDKGEKHGMWGECEYDIGSFEYCGGCQCHRDYK